MEEGGCGDFSPPPVMTFWNHRPSSSNTFMVNWLLVPTHLQYPAADVSVTCLAFNAKLGVVVGLAVRNTIPAKGNPHRKRKLGGLRGRHVEVPVPAASGVWAKIRSTGELVKNANSQDTPQISGIKESLGGRPGNLYLGKLPEQAWKPLVCCWPARSFPFSCFPLPTGSPDPLSYLYPRGLFLKIILKNLLRGILFSIGHICTWHKQRHKG